jgi:light-regulated signal transduction histidine kinase (bacteriophytochrome)
LLESHSDGLDSEGKRLVGILRTSSLHVSGQIDGIMEFLRLGRDTMCGDIIDMDEAVQMVVKALAPNRAGRKLRIEISPLPDVLGDASMISRVWTNLLGNAMKFTSSKDNPTISVGAVSDDRETTYHVRDNGVGFDMQFAGGLFEVFSRLHGADFGGNGMGLAIAQRIVFRHGGRMWAEGKVGEGATFYFALPLLIPAHV